MEYFIDTVTVCTLLVIRSSSGLRSAPESRVTPCVACQCEATPAVPVAMAANKSVALTRL